MKDEQPTLVDQQQIKFNMAATAILLTSGYLLNSWVFVAIAIFCQLTGSLGLSFAPYRLLYTNLMVRTGLIKPNPIPDNHAPHRFAAFVGALFNIIGLSLILTGANVAGWVFVGIVFVLSLLNLFLGFCAGCFMYYMMNKLGVPGFKYSEIK